MIRTRFQLQPLLGCSTVLGTYLLVGWTVEGGLGGVWTRLYPFDPQINPLIATSYYFTLMAVTVWAISYLLQWACNCQSTSKLVRAALLDCVHVLLGYLPLYGYLLSATPVPSTEVRLLPFNLLLAFLLLLGGVSLSGLTDMRLNVCGQTMIATVVLLTCSETYWSGFMAAMLRL